MENNTKWRFVGNNYTSENGLNTSDMEMFQSDPISSLAREICQNSIDAKRKEQEKVIVEFKAFEISKQEIKGYDRLKSEIENCKEYKRDSNRKEYEALQKMSKEIDKEKISCLRISDFNTTGLYENKFHLLTKASGITDKEGSKGGSKGIGKYASFVASAINTVFYSTYTIEEKMNSLGISKLCSAPMPDTDEKTMGIGYYCIDQKNAPLEEQLFLDKDFIRDTYGTDLYIIAFKKEENWKKEILEKVLDSFLVAIFNGELEVKIDDILVNKDTLEKIIYSHQFSDNNCRKSIISQYVLMSEKNNVYVKEFDIFEYGKIKVFVKGFGREEKDIATNNCIMIRYPYMKIKCLNNISTLPCSAMCIIGDNKLNKMLRDIENAQHTDWHLKRVDEPLRPVLKDVIRKMKDCIVDFVVEVLSISETEKLDIEGAGDYLPNTFSEVMDAGQQEEKVVQDKPTIVKKVLNRKYSIKPVEKTDIPSALIPDIGDHGDSDEEDSLVPEGHNSGSGGTPHETENKTTSNDDGDKDILRCVPLTEVKKTFFVVDKEQGEYVLIMNSNYEENNCELEVKYYDDVDNQYNAQIYRCTVNGENAELENDRAIKFKIHPGKTKIQIKTNLTEYYRCEVKLYANR